MKNLSQTIKVNGVGIKNLTATLVQRTDKKAWYRRSDDVHEVFKVKVAPAQEIYGKQYPEREVYPNNEDFGHSAWCYNNEKFARDKYEKI